MARKTDMHVWDRTPTDTRTELQKLLGREQRIAHEIARRADRPQRANTKGEDLQAQLDDVRAKIRTINDRATEGRIILHLTELLRRDYRELVIAHPPKDGDEQDARTGFNGDTFPGALIRAAVTSAEDFTTGAPVHLDFDTWLADDRDDAMGNADYFDLFRKAHNLHHEPSPQDPPVRAA